MQLTISNPIEFLTAEHGRIDALIALATTRDLGVRRAAFDKLADKLVEHLAIKQELVYPIVKRWISDATMTEVLVAHAEIKRTLAGLVWFDVDDPLFDARFETLKTLVEGHTQWQEDELFVVLARTASTTELTRLGASIEAWFARLESAFEPTRDPGLQRSQEVTHPYS